MRYPQALGQQQLQLVAKPLAPVAQVRALVREGVLEKLFAGEELEIRVVDPALANPLIGQPVNVLEQQQPDHEAGLDARPAVLAVKRRDLAVDPVPIDLADARTPHRAETLRNKLIQPIPVDRLRQPHQLVPHVDDLVQPRPEQIVRSRRLVLLWPHRPLRCTTESWSAGKGNPKTKLQGSDAQNIKTLQSGNAS